MFMVTMFARDSPMSGPGPSDIEECSSSSMMMKHNNRTSHVEDSICQQLKSLQIFCGQPWRVVSPQCISDTTSLLNSAEWLD